VFDNDALNGAAIVPADVTLTETVADPNGALTLNPDGSVDVAPGTPAGMYSLTYEICEVLNPTNCATAVVDVTVDAATIVGMDDDYSATPINSVSGGILPTIYANDTLNGAPINFSDVDSTITDPDGLTGLVLNSDGSLVVPPNTPPGTYMASVEICESLNPTNCITTVETIVVEAAPITATDDPTGVANASDGGVGVVDVLANDTFNGMPIDPADVTVTEAIADPDGVLTLNPDGTVDVAPGSPAGTYQLTYEI